MSTAKIMRLPIPVSPQKWEGTFQCYEEPEKYGHITVKDENRSVYVYENTLLLEGVKFIQGQQVRFNVFSLGGNRLGAINIEVLGSQTKRTPEKKVQSEWYKGKLKWYDPQKGYGLITLDRGGKDVLLHAFTLKKMGFDASKRMRNVRVSVQVDFDHTDPPQVTFIWFV